MPRSPTSFLAIINKATGIIGRCITLSAHCFLTALSKKIACLKLVETLPTDTSLENNIYIFAMAVHRASGAQMRMIHFNLTKKTGTASLKVSIVRAVFSIGL